MDDTTAPPQEDPAQTAPDDGGTSFEVDEADPLTPTKLDYERQSNLVPLLQAMGEEGEEFLKDVGDMVVRHKEIDWKSSEDFRQRRARQIELFAGILPPRPEGQENIAQIHLPIIGQAVLLLHATIHGQLFPPGGAICGGAPTTPMSNDRAKRLGLHMNWQITQKIPEYIPAHDRGGMQFLIYGNAFSKWYYRDSKERPCFTMIQADDLILPYGAQSVDPNMSDVVRITQRMRYYRHELEAEQDAGYYVNVEELYEKDGEKVTDSTPSRSAGNGSVSDTNRGPMADTMDKVQGQKEPGSDDGDNERPRIILEQHRWLKLPGENRERPVIATVDELTRKLLFLGIREDEDPRDRARFNREQAAADAAMEAQLAMHAQAMDQHQETVRQLTAPSVVPHPETGEPVTVPSEVPPEALPEAPQPPEPPPGPKPVKMVPIDWFTKYDCIPNAEGIYAYGIGYLLEGANITADTMMSQIVAAMTLSLFPTYLYSRQARMGRGDLSLKLGGGVQVDLPPEQMQNAFFQLQFPPPNPNAIKIVESQQAQVQDFVGASEILSGEVGGSNETATTTEIRMSAARQNLAVMGIRYNRARAAELKLLARINSRTLDPVEYFAVATPEVPMVPPPPPPPAPGMPPLPPPPPPDPIKMEKVARDEYLEDFQITFTCDPNMASRPQLVGEAQKALQAAMSVPPGILDPMAQAMTIRLAYVGLLRAMGREDMAKVIEGSPPPNPMQLMAAQQQHGGGGPPGQKPGPNGPPQPGKGPPNGQGNVPKPPAGPAPPMGPGPNNGPPSAPPQ